MGSLTQDNYFPLTDPRSLVITQAMCGSPIHSCMTSTARRAAPVGNDELVCNGRRLGLSGLRKRDAGWVRKCWRGDGRRTNLIRPALRIVRNLDNDD